MKYVITPKGEYAVLKGRKVIRVSDVEVLGIYDSDSSILTAIATETGCDKETFEIY